MANDLIQWEVSGGRQHSLFNSKHDLCVTCISVLKRLISWDKLSYLSRPNMQDMSPPVPIIKSGFASLGAYPLLVQT